jgi:hypothetical protein
VADVDGAPSPQEVYGQLMKEVFGPALRDVGLRGSNGRFELPSATHWALLGFQKSTYNSDDEVRFTVNLSAIRRDEWDAQAASKPHLGKRPAPSIHYGTWANQVRIGSLTPDGEDKWWRLGRGNDVDPVAADAVTDLLTYGVPWLREHTRA